LALAAVVLSTLILVEACDAKDEAPPVITPIGDAAIDKAEEDARASLEQFWAWANKHPENAKASLVKVALDSDGGPIEALWMNELRLVDGQIRGQLVNEPMLFPKLHKGSYIEVDPSRVTDWSIVWRGKHYGEFTTRVMLDRAHPANEADIRAALAGTTPPDAQ
jgi:uncharacterized protein YegJ (DUF2314 family)